jgi:hypothetical protein
LPPETTTIYLILKLIAMIKQVMRWNFIQFENNYSVFFLIKI